jgi:endonuclease/exonuclease/phosphatase family metal-dependent hydrolase
LSGTLRLNSNNYVPTDVTSLKTSNYWSGTWDAWHRTLRASERFDHIFINNKIVPVKFCVNKISASSSGSDHYLIWSDIKVYN